MADFTTPSRFLETILSGPMEGRRKLYSRLGMAARDPIDELMNSALEFERNETASLDRFLAWFSRGDGRRSARSRPARQRGAGDDRARRQGPGGAGRDPRRRDRRSGQARPDAADASTSQLERRGIGAAAPPEKGRALPAVRRDHRGRGAARPRGALAAALRRADPRRGAADRQRRPAQGAQGRRRPAAGQLLAPVVEQAMARIGAVPGEGTSRCGTASAARRRAKARARQGRAAAGRRARLGAAPRSARGAPAAAAGAVRDRRRRRSARRRRARRCAPRRCAEPGSTSCSSGLPAVEPRARAAAADAGWSDRRASPTPPRASEIVEQVCGDPLRPALRRSVRPRLARRGAARRDLARRAGDRRHRRPAAGRGRPRLGDRLQDRAGAGERCRRSRPPIAPDGRPMPTRCG